MLIKIITDKLFFLNKKVTISNAFFNAKNV